LLRNTRFPSEERESRERRKNQKLCSKISLSLKRYHSGVATTGLKNYEKATLSKPSHLNYFTNQQTLQRSSTEHCPEAETPGTRQAASLGWCDSIQEEDLSVGPQCYNVGSLISQ